MTDTVLHMVGHVGTDIDYRRVGATSTELSTFRMATTPRRWDKAERRYVDGTTTWITVQCWRSLAVHVRDSVRRGDPVIVAGKLKTEEWVKDDVRNSRFILDAAAVGHDLNRGVSQFKKLSRQAEAPVDDNEGAVEALRRIEEVEAVGGDSDSDTDAGGQPTALRGVS